MTRSAIAIFSAALALGVLTLPQEAEAGGSWSISIGGGAYGYPGGYYSPPVYYYPQVYYYPRVYYAPPVYYYPRVYSYRPRPSWSLHYGSGRHHGYRSYGHYPRHSSGSHYRTHYGRSSRGRSASSYSGYRSGSRRRR